MLGEITVFEELVKIFSFSRLNRLARETGFICRRGKLRAVDFVRLCVFGVGAPGLATLEQMVAALRENRIRISKQSLDERFNARGVKYLKTLAGRVFAQKLVQRMDFGWAGRFNRVLIRDSTIGRLYSKCSGKFPGFGGAASPAAYKVQYCFDLLSGNIADLLLEPASRPDSAQRFTGLVKNDLCLFDLGYFTLQNLAAISRAGAFFVCRLKFNTAVYTKDGDDFRRVDLLKTIKKMRTGQVLEMKVFLGTKAKLPMRLILQKLPEKVSSELRRRLKSDTRYKRKNISADRLEFCEVSAYLTNVAQPVLPAESIRKIYSLRWQIEIVFKCWKSHFALDQIRNVKPERFECCFYGRLILVILATRFSTLIKTNAWNKARIEISEFKAFAILKTKVRTIRLVLLERRIKPETFIRELWKLLTGNARKEAKNKQKKPSQIMMYGT